MPTMRSLLCTIALGACAAVPGTPPRLDLPPRATTAATGTQLLPALRGLSLPDRETIVWRELVSGNVPTCLRELVPITTRTTIDGKVHTATFWCTPDYLGLGADLDWFRMPMTPTLAQRFADRVDCALPTRRMVDAIWQQSPLQLAPFPRHPQQYDILSVDLFHQHHLHIETQRGGQPGQLLTAGCKKDVVVSALLAANPGRVCIYGWHQLDGTPIQPLSKVHTFPHVDYSHGIRLVARQVLVDGKAMTVDAVLAHPSLHVLLSDEGPFASWRYLPLSAGRGAQGAR